MLNSMLSMSRWYKRLVSLIIDTIFVVSSFYAAYWTRIGDVRAFDAPNVVYVVVATLAITLFTFSKLGLYRAILRYLTFHALAVIGIGTLVSAVSVGWLAYYFDASIPRSVPLIYGAYLCLLCGGSRLIVRTLVSQRYSKDKKKVLIYGAGVAGRQLALALRSSETHRVVGFIDEDRTLDNTVILGLQVHTVESATQLVNKQSINQILLAIPSVSRVRRKQILDTLVHLPAEVLTIPDMGDIVSGKANIDELKDVAIDDLLGRDPVAPQQSLMEANIKDKVVMVTGAGGSIGSELCRQIVQQKPKTLVLFELSEFGLYQIDRELRLIVESQLLDIEIAPLLGSVQRINRLSATMKAFKSSNCLSCSCL